MSFFHAREEGRKRGALGWGGAGRVLLVPGRGEVRRACKCVVCLFVSQLCTAIRTISGLCMAVST